MSRSGWFLTGPGLLLSAILFPGFVLCVEWREPACNYSCRCGSCRQWACAAQHAAVLPAVQLHPGMPLAHLARPARLPQVLARVKFMFGEG